VIPPLLYFNWNAVCAQKVLLTLVEKNVPYELRHLDLRKFEQHDPAYLALNPAGVVPTLVHGDEVITESTVIIEYLDDAFAEPRLRPRSAAAQARMRWWMKCVDDVVHPSIRPISFMQFVAPRVRGLSDAALAAVTGAMQKKDLAEVWQRVARAPYSDDELAAYLHKIEDTLDRMEHDLADRAWLAGDEYSLADIAITPYFRRLAQLGKQALWLARPRTEAWLQRIQTRPSFAILDTVRTQYAPAETA
jgi:glutathione S-transferase